MALFAAAGRIAATLVAMAGTRLELAAVEFQHDARRLLGYLAWTLLAALLAAGALLLAAFFVIVLCWDTYRLQAVAGMVILFGLGAAAILVKVRTGLDAQAPLFSATLAELHRDIAYLRGHAASATAEAEPVFAHARAGGRDD